MNLTRNYDATVLSDLIARRVAAGYTEADSRQLLADFLDRYEGDNLAFVLHYNGFATKAQAAAVASTGGDDRG